jgi:hypothetical protein
MAGLEEVSMSEPEFATEFDTTVPPDAPSYRFVRLCSCMHTPEQHDPESSYHCRVCDCGTYAPPD